MYQFKDEISFRQFFWWDKKLIKNMNWTLLPKSSKSVFPVIACHANEKGEAFPSERTIAILAGVSDKIAREGIRGLKEFPGFKFNYYLSQRGKRAKKYMLNLPSSNNSGSAFPFFKFVLEAGIWREMIPSAKALYPVMRCFGFFDVNLYEEFEDDLEIEINDFDEIYSNREYDFCEAELSVMAEYAGLHRNSIAAALNDLEQNCLIETLSGHDGWKVFLKSKDSTTWRRDHLNKKVMDSYRHILQCTKITGNDAQKLPNHAQKGSER